MPGFFSMPFFTKGLYFDHNATTPLADEVRKAMETCMANNFGNASSLHTHGRTSRGIIDGARKSVATLLGCDTDQIIFTSGGTEANNTVIKGVFQSAGKGHIITSLIEHESILGACSQIEKRGASITRLRAGPDGRIDPDDVKKSIRPDTILISIMHANNETGAIQPVEQIGKIARQAKVPFHTDAVQSFGKIPTHVEEIGCEFLTLTAHKINGPKGIGVLYSRGHTPFEPLIFGGDQERSRRAGTEGVHQIVGIGAAAQLAAGRMNREYERMKKLRRRLTSGIKHICENAIFNEAPSAHQMPGTVNVTFPGKSGIRILAGFDCYEIGVSIGSACTADRIEPSHVLLGMGIGEEPALSSIRISMGTSTSTASIMYLLWVLKRVLQADPAGFGYLDPQHLTEEVILSTDNFLIDLRLPHERMTSPSIPQAKIWSYVGFERYISQIPSDKKVIIMCGTGILSTGAGYRLANAGHGHVRVVFGGYAAWRGLYPDMIERLSKTGQPH